MKKLIAFGLNLKAESILLIGIVLFVLLSGMPLPSAGQSVGAESILEEIKNASHDTTRVNLYYRLSRRYWNRNADSAIIMADKGLELATRIHFEKGMALNYLSKGLMLTNKGRFPEALDCQLKSLALSKKLKLDGLSGNVYSNIGIIYSRMLNHSKAQEFYERSLAIMERYGAAAALSVLVNLGDVCEKAHNYNKALEYDFRALAISRKDSTTNPYVLSTLLYNLGSTHLAMGKNAEAIQYVEESLALSQKLSDPEGLCYCYNLMADIYRQRKMFKQSIASGLKSLALVKALGNNELTKDTYHRLTEAYREAHDYKNALHFKDLEVSFKDSLNTVGKEREVNDLLTRYKLEEKQREIDLLNKDTIIRQKELEKKRLEKITFTVAVIFLIALAIFLLYDNRRKQKRNSLLNLQKDEISQQKEMISHQNKELHDINNVKNRLLAVIGHDLRSPLNSLSSLVALMRLKSLTPDEMEGLSDQLSDELELTRNVLENLLTWARFQLNDQGPTFSSFNLKVLVDENFKLIDRSARLKGVMLQNHTLDRIDLFADKEMIDIVIRNLLSNAVKYSRSGDTVSIHIAVGAEAMVQVTVMDTGIGIKEEMKSFIFSMGSGGSQRGTSNEKGSGLGLSLCKELVEKNHGTISFTSEPGKGSAFTFSIPYKQDREALRGK